MKRVYVREFYRRSGIARTTVSAAEKAAREKGFRFMILETGVQNTEAIALYQSMGYRQIENFGQFATDPVCLCMKKEI